MSSRPIVLLHGFTGQRESWDGVLAALSIDTRADVTALPIGGHHLGPPCAGSWKENVALLAEQVAAATESRPADIVGYSLGARLSLGLLAEYPELIATLTLISVNPGLETRHQRHQRRHDDRTWITLLRTRGQAAFVDAWQALPLFATQASLDPALLARQRTLRLKHDPHQLALCLEQMGLAEMPNYRDVLRHSEKKRRLVVGARDEKFCRLARDVVPDSHVLVIPDCGHNVPLEAPRALAAIVASRLTVR